MYVENALHKFITINTGSVDKHSAHKRVKSLIISMIGTVFPS